MAQLPAAEAAAPTPGPPFRIHPLSPPSLCVSLYREPEECQCPGLKPDFTGLTDYGSLKNWRNIELPLVSSSQA